MRSPFLSNASMKLRAASRTAGQAGPIDPDTSSTSDRSTRRRVASLALDTVTSLKLPMRMNVVGIVAVALIVTMCTPDASSVCMS